MAAPFISSVALFDAEHRLVDWDGGFVSEWASAGPAVHRGVPYAEILRSALDNPETRRMIDQGLAAPVTEAVVRERIEGFGTDRSHEYRTAAGRVVLVEERRLVSGGVHRVARDVTEDRQSETALAEARKRLDAVDSLDYGVLTETIRSPDGSYTFPPLGEDLCRLLELPPALVGGDATLVFSRFETSPEENARSAALMENAARTLEAFVQEYRVRDGKDRVRWLRQSMLPRREPDGTVIYSGVIRDVTREKEAEDQVEMLRSVVVQSSDSIVIFENDPSIGDEGRIVYANTRFSELFGWAVEEVLNQPESVLATKPLMTGAFIAQTRLRGDGKPVEFETSSRDGRVFWVEARITTIQRFADGRFRWAIISRDITERRKTEEAVRVSEERFRLLAEATNEVIWDLDLETGVTWWNSALANHYGHSQMSIPETFFDWRDLVHPDDRERVFERAYAVVSGNETLWQDEYRFRRGDDSFATVVSRAFVVRDGAGEPTRMLGSMADVTQQREMQERLARSQRLEAVGQLTGGIAHDFNNLLTVILGSTEMLADTLAGDPEDRELAELAAGAAERGAELTQRLLAFGRRQALEPRIIDVNKLVAGMDGLLRRSLRGDIDIETILAGGAGSSLIDPAQFENVILNLAINARDAMPEGGRLTIETSNVTFDEDQIFAQDEIAAGSYVMVSVSDTGTGMTPEVLGRAFEPFFTTKEVGKGSGLGLSMIFGFMKQSGGHAKIYSEVGEGTTVKLYLPRASQEHQAQDASADEAASAGGREHILAVEDDPAVRKFVVTQLRGLGYRVTAATNGPEALNILHTLSDVDLLFTDIIMPGGMNGRQLADEAEKMSPGLKVLFTSGYTQNAIVHHGRLDPDVHFLPKPFRRRDLATKIRQVLEGAEPTES
jgi:PAS domain S-box-containing protein